MDIDKYTLIKWLNEDINHNTKIFDKILYIEEHIISYIETNNLILDIPRNIFLMQLIKYIYKNSIA